jgi:predicted heme/steroid binding protein
VGIFVALPAQATYDYAVKTGKGCIFCHQESTGGSLKVAGFAYIRNGYQYPIPKRILEKAESLQAPFHKTLRFTIGYIHLVAAIIFFGAIFYIHIFVKPTRLRGGIPKPERLLGLSCMLTLTLSGAYLTWTRIDKWEQFVNNTFGLMLLVKILLFALMVVIGVSAVTVIHRGMKSESQSSDVGKGEITPASLHRFDGAEGRPAYIGYEKGVYDVSQSSKWKDGRHFGKHRAGEDLTEALDGAPHGPEVLDNVQYVDAISGKMEASGKPGAHQRIFVVMAYTNLVIIFLILACISVWRWGFPVRLLPESRSEVLAGNDCIGCHRKRTPGIYHDWETSTHSKVGVNCYKCHSPGEKKEFISEAHLEHDKTSICIVVTPKRCSGCHPEEAAQYGKSKHANTHEIIWKVDYWLNDGMNSAVERTTGCYACHGTMVEVFDGRPVEGTWPNVGVGRINPDGSLGSCSSCHTRHAFSAVEARKPEACDQCHLGPDHPQIEIYNESKHGTIYHAEGDKWNWDPEDGDWKAGRDFRAPTCAVCHMSAAGEISGTHDVTERLAWETQAPLTVRPSAFGPFPAPTDWAEERKKMKGVCLQCHAISWTDDHFTNLDKVVRHYNEVYFKPIKKVVDDLYEGGLLSGDTHFDEPLEWEFYELWHHEGRRARMGAAMMAPDYAWWHGFYELKRRFANIVAASRDMKEKGERPIFEVFPGRYEK